MHIFHSLKSKKYLLFQNFCKKKNRGIIQNIFSLYFINGINYLLPLLTTPYIARIIGAEKLGLITFSTAFISYFTVLIDYGFNMSATRSLSLIKNSAEKMNDLFNTILVVKCLFFLITFLFISIIIYSIPKFNQFWYLHYIVFISIIGNNILTPYWFFQGVQKMKYLTYFTVISKSIFTFSIFLFVKSTSDYILVPIFNTIGSMLVGMYSIFIIYRKFKFKYYLPNIEKVIIELRSGWHIFLSNIYISMYTSSVTFILGLISGYQYVAFYSVADKIIQIAKSSYTPICESIYPVAAKKFSTDKNDGLHFVKKSSISIVIIAFIVSIILFIFSENIILILFGSQYAISIIILRIISFVPFFVSLSNILGVQVLLNLGYSKLFSRISFFVCLFSVILSFCFVTKYHVYASATIVLISEISVVIIMFLYVYAYFKKSNHLNAEQKIKY